MRILMISDVYFPRVNGVSTSIMLFRKELQAQGHEVALIAPAYEPVHEKRAKGDFRIPSRAILFDPEDRMMKGRSIKRLLPALARLRYDVVHIQTPFVAYYLGRWLARHLDLPYVLSYHTFFEEYLYHYLPMAPGSLMKWVARHYSRSQCNEADGLIVPSSAMLDVLHGYGIQRPAAVIPTGIDMDEFAAGDGLRFRDRYKIDHERPLLLYVGRVAFEKNIDFLLDVMVSVRRRCSGALLVIAGEGPAKDHLRKRAEQLGLRENVMFTGYLSRDADLADCYAAGDLFVFASRTETQGLVVLEAMASGLPVVSTAVMGTKEIFRAGKGVMVTEEDAGAFSDNIFFLLRNWEAHARLAEEGRKYAAQWSVPELTSRLVGWYQEIREVSRGERACLPEGYAQGRIS